MICIKLLTKDVLQKHMWFHNSYRCMSRTPFTAISIVFQTCRLARHGHGHGQARHGAARHYAARRPGRAVPIVPACPAPSPGTALCPVGRAVSCRLARQPGVPRDGPQHSRPRVWHCHRVQRSCSSSSSRSHPHPRALETSSSGVASQTSAIAAHVATWSRPELLAAPSSS